VQALIGQLQGQCCVYEADLDGGCQPRSQAYTGLLGRYQCPKWAAQCLQSMGSEAKEAIPALIQALETGPANYETGDGPIPTRDAIILALGKIGDRRAVKPLLKALQAPRPSEGWIFAPAASGRPLQGYDGTIQALGLLGPTAQATVPELLPLLQQSDLYIVERTANALAQIQDPSAIPALIALLQNPAKQKIAARAVGKFGPQAEVPILIQMFEQASDLPSQSTALAAIKEIRGSTPFDQAQANYFQKQDQTWQSLTAIAKQQGNQSPLVINSFAKEKYYIALAEGETLHVSFDRSLTNLNSEQGEIWIAKNDQKVFQTSFTSLSEMQKLFTAKLKALK
jgi:HEAT repeat protein